jgi:Mitochondrial branched-chain alpha-ketoacid dehydrogenase kinase
MEHVKSVKEAYHQSFNEIMDFQPAEIETPDREQQFADLIESIYERHGNALVQMARGAYEFRQAVRAEKGDHAELEEETHNFLDRFYMCRIGIRVLIGQYLALRQPPVENYVGIICSQTSPYEIVKRAIDDAAFMCTRKYGEAPDVIMTGRLDLTFPYVPTHLRTYRIFYYLRFVRVLLVPLMYTMTNVFCFFVVGGCCCLGQIISCWNCSRIPCAPRWSFTALTTRTFHRSR